MKASPLLSEPSRVAIELPPQLVYATDVLPGIARRRRGAGFSYSDAQGRLIKDGDTLERIRRLAIPPAWTGVWISLLVKGHLQATGRDAKGRKQYRYHDLWREIRDASKFERLLRFAEVLPQIREHMLGATMPTA